MNSVDVSWNGQCKDHNKQEELISYLERLSETNNKYLNRGHSATIISRTISASQRRGPRDRQDIEIMNAQIFGRIIVDSDVLVDAKEFEAYARRAELELYDDDSGPFGAARIETASLRGVSFRLFDPRRLYRGNDRLDFVFLRCPDLPFLDGVLVSASPSEDLTDASRAVLREADWYLARPQINLCHHLTNWGFMLLSWIKYFYVSDLYWSGNEELEEYRLHESELDGFTEKFGLLRARQESFEDLLKAFEEDAAESTGKGARQQRR